MKTPEENKLARACRMAGLWLLILGGLPFPAAGQNHYLGLDFLDEVTEIQTFPFVQFPDWILDYTYYPTPVTEQINTVNGGGLAGWTEAEAREAISLAVERIYRAVDAGEPQQTLRIAIYNGPVPTSLAGRRLNVVIGHNQTAAEYILGRAEQGAYDDTVGFPDDSYAAAVLPPHLDALSDLDFGTPEAVFNHYAGTTAHEIGHIYSLVHVDRGDEMPYPIMATGTTGLLNPDRVTERRFTDEPDTQGPGKSSVSVLVSVIGTVSAADFNMDDDVDVFQTDGNGDAQILASHLGMTSGARMRDGDANNDGDVDAWQLDGNGDAQLLSENIGASLDLGADQGAGTAEALYNPHSGELWFDCGTGVAVIGVGSAVMYPGNVDHFFTAAPAQNLSVSLAFFNPTGLPVGEDSVGLMLPAGLAQGDMVFSYTPVGGPTVEVPVFMIPEPGTITMTVMGLLGVIGILLRRRRR